MNKLTEGVGKKIVDALKQQSDVEIQNIIENPVEQETAVEPEITQTVESNLSFDTDIQDSLFHANVVQEKTVETFETEDFDMPTNVAVLKQLISQLPAGVSKQTGAQIIKQTMEALGISMKAVLQEAQQVQENLNNSSKNVKHLLWNTENK